MKPTIVIVLVVLMILSSACGTSPEVIASQTATAATATALASLPKAGHWEGEIVQFDITLDGRINNFRMVTKTDLFSCGIKVQEIVIKQDNTFAYRQLDPLNNLSKVEKEFLTANKLATVIETDKGEEFEIARINGKFESATSLTGDVWILSCEGKVFAPGAQGTWIAEWKKP